MTTNDPATTRLDVLVLARLPRALLLAAIPTVASLVLCRAKTGARDEFLLDAVALR